MPYQTYFNLETDKQQAIYDALIDEMTLHTYEHFNIQNVIKQANISRGSFYQYFNGKKDVYEYIFSLLVEKKMAHFGESLDPNADIPFEKRFENIYMKALALEHNHPRLVKAGKKMVESEYYKASKPFQDGVKQGIDLYESFIKKDQDKGLIRSDIDARLLATIMMEVMQKITYEELKKVTTDYKMLEQKALELLDIFKKGIINHV